MGTWGWRRVVIGALSICSHAVSRNTELARLVTGLIKTPIIDSRVGVFGTRSVLELVSCLAHSTHGGSGHRCLPTGGQGSNVGSAGLGVLGKGKGGITQSTSSCTGESGAVGNYRVGQSTDSLGIEVVIRVTNRAQTGVHVHHSALRGHRLEHTTGLSVARHQLVGIGAVLA